MGSKGPSFSEPPESPQEDAQEMAGAMPEMSPQAMAAFQAALQSGEIPNPEDLVAAGLSPEEAQEVIELVGGLMGM